jgi:hypothetical protein
MVSISKAGCLYKRGLARSCPKLDEIDEGWDANVICSHAMPGIPAIAARDVR